MQNTLVVKSSQSCPRADNAALLPPLPGSVIITSPHIAVRWTATGGTLQRITISSLNYDYNMLFKFPLIVQQSLYMVYSLASATTQSHTQKWCQALPNGNHGDWCGHKIYDDLGIFGNKTNHLLNCFVKGRLDLPVLNLLSLSLLLPTLGNKTVQAGKMYKHMCDIYSFLTRFWISRQWKIIWNQWTKPNQMPPISTLSTCPLQPSTGMASTH